MDQDLGEVILEEPAKPARERVDAEEGKAGLNLGEHEAVEAFCFLQVMNLVLRLVSQVKGRRMKGGSTFYFSLKQTQGTLAWAHGLCRDAERRLSSLVLTPTSQFKTKTPLNRYEITTGTQMSDDLGSQTSF